MKTNYDKIYLSGLKYYTKIDDLTIQDVYAAMLYMINKGTYSKVAKSLWSKYQFDDLYKRIVLPDEIFINEFVTAVYQTRYDRRFQGFKKELHPQSPQDDFDIDFETNSKSSPENDMQMISDLLLRNDDVYFS